MASSKREKLVETALDLFYRQGFHATGIERILAESGVAKMTLYNHFRSKDELILAALRLRDEQFRNSFMQAVEKKAGNPVDRLLAVFDVMEDWFKSEGFRGCMFINASAEFADPGDPVRAASAEHKRLMLSYVGDLASDAGAREAGELAEQICLLMEGAIVLAHVMGRTEAARQAKRAAEVLISRAMS